MAQGSRLSVEDWTGAALAALAEGGLAAIAVEPLAVRLGTTKGSFYWHFRNREALLTATLERWERVDTDDVIALVERTAADPAARMRVLLTAAISPALPAGITANAVELALQASATHPLVAPVLDRVTRRRLDYLVGMFAALGFAADEAERRSLLAYTAYLGHAQLAHATPSLAPKGDALAAYIDAVLARLAGP